MVNERTCIICGGIAGSKEHLFPAALGGMRVSKKIYCQTHNNLLGKHVQPLVNVLNLINAIIGVKHDRSKKISTFSFVKKDSQNYIYSGENIKLALPKNLSELKSPIGSHKIEFSSIEDFNKWKKLQEDEGYSIEVVNKPEFKTEIVTESLSSSIEIGAPEFQLSIIYLSLTFLAYFYPSISRQTSLKRIKDILLNGDKLDNQIKYIDPNKLDFIQQHDLKNKHFIAIGLLKEEKIAIAVVGFFGSLCIGVEIGNVETDLTEYSLGIIDPLATHQKMDYDFKEMKFENKRLSIPDNEESISYIERIISSKKSNPLNIMLKNAFTYQEDKILDKFMNKIDQIKNYDQKKLEIELSVLLNDESQRFFNFIKYCIDGYLSEKTNCPYYLKLIMKEIISTNGGGYLGLTSKGVEALDLVKNGIKREINELIENDKLTKENLHSLLFTGVGCAKVGEIVFEYIAKFIK